MTVAKMYTADSSQLMGASRMWSAHRLPCARSASLVSVATGSPRTVNPVRSTIARSFSCAKSPRPEPVSAVSEPSGSREGAMSEP
eukprot:1189935-Prorocentrum_minimum.AAC.2